MDYFDYRNGKYYCENVALDRVAKQFGTPVYVYSKKTIVEHIKKLKKAFSEIDPLICYSVKSNSNLAILDIVKNEGIGFDIVSAGELYRLKKIKAPFNKVVFAGAGKTIEEIEDAIKSNIFMFNAESVPELWLINKAASKLKKKVSIALRVNPDVDAETHKHITTGKKENKFGISFKKIDSVFRELSKMKFIIPEGLHMHIGSQITRVEPFLKAIDRLLLLKEKLEKKNITLKYLNIGGGLGIIYNKEKAVTADKFAAAIIKKISGSGLKLILEPGRFIVGNAGVILCNVTYVKKSDNKYFAITDAGMNDLIRPSLYGAYHEILTVKKGTAKKRKYDVVGPICETGDFFAKDRSIPEIQDNDILCIRSAGAYGFAMSSRYNTRCLPAEVLVSGSKMDIVGKRETYEDIVKRESKSSL